MTDIQKPTYEELLIENQNLKKVLSEKKDIEKSSQENEERFRLAFDNANIGMCLVDTQGRLFKVNRRMCEIFGYSREEMECMTVNDIAHPNYKDVSPTFIKRANVGEVDHTEFEKKYIHKNGNLIVAQVASSLVRSAIGEPMYFISHVIDITERRYAEDALIESQTFLHEIIENNGAAIYVKDREGKHVLVNKKYEEVTGMKRELIIGKADKDIYPSSIANNFRNNDLEVIEKEIVLEKEEVIENSNGKKFFLSIKFPWRDKNNVIKGICGISTEITERKNAEAALQESRNFLHDIIENNGTVICVKDHDGVHKLVNKKWEEVIGMKRDMILGKKFEDYYPGEMADALRRNDLEVIQNGKAFEYDELINDGKTKRHFLSVKFPMRDENNAITGICVMANEITERKRAEEELKEAKDLAEAYARELFRLAALDGLTKIANRRRFDEYLEVQWNKHLSEQIPLALILIDIDYFKQYNDYYGHQAGDECLVRVAQTIAAVNQRPTDFTARYGGEEFVVILPNTNIRQGLIIAESMRNAILSLSIPHAKSEVNQYITLSLGVTALTPSQDRSLTELVAQADTALYKAKSEGRNRVIASLENKTN
jgi:diguanylate cyclase (GGDEF)-like protein/PAS domain S-box-containing protein